MHPTVANAGRTQDATTAEKAETIAERLRTGLCPSCGSPKVQVVTPDWGYECRACKFKWIYPAVGEDSPGFILKSDVVTTLEIAQRLGVQDQTVRVWRRRHRNFPEPFMYAARQGIWDFREVKAWYDAR